MNCHPETDVNQGDINGWTALHFASYNGFSEILEILLQSPDIDINKGRALYYASQRGHLDVARFLLQRPEIDVNKDSPVWIASENENREVLRLLLEHPKIDVTEGIATDEDGYLNITTLLFGRDITNVSSSEELLVASLLGNLTKVTALLNDNETDINTRDQFQRTALFWASLKAHLDIVNLLLENADIDVNAGNPLLASELGNSGVVKLLLSQPQILVNIGRYTDGATSLFLASMNGHSETVEMILQHPKIDVNIGLITDGATALYIASQNGHEETVKLLLDHPDIEANKGTWNRNTPLMKASLRENPRVVERLLAVINIDVNYATMDGKTALFYAVSNKGTENLGLILRCPTTNTHLVDEEYKTALDRVREANHTEFEEMFDSRGLLQMRNGHTCCSNKINRGLHTAVGNDDLPWIKIFLVCPKLEINVHNKEGYTPLTMATKMGLGEMVEIFLRDQRIDVNKPNTGERQSAILFASEYRHVDILKMLLLHPQTFVNQMDVKGQSALSIALQSYNPTSDTDIHYYRIVKLLLRCPKTHVSGEILENANAYGHGNDIGQVLQMHSSSMQMKATCCINVISSILNAAWIGDFRAIRGLLKCPGSEINVNAVDRKGRTPLYIASMMGHLEAMKTLLRHPNINANIGATLEGCTAFSIASEKANFEIMEQFIINGRLDKNQGWCSGNWVQHETLCKMTNAHLKAPTAVTRPGQ